MLGRVRSLVRDLTGRNDAVLVGHLLGQLDATLDGVASARRAATGDVDINDARDQIQQIEHRGNRHRRDLIVDLSTTLAPPIDREDLFRLSRSVDDVLDNLLDLVREMAMFGLHGEPLLVDALDGVGEGVAFLRNGVAAIVDQPATTLDDVRQAKSNQIRHKYQLAVAELLPHDEVMTGRHIKRRLVLRRLDVVGLRLGEAADALADGTVKRSI